MPHRPGKAQSFLVERYFGGTHSEVLLHSGDTPTLSGVTNGGSADGFKASASPATAPFRLYRRRPTPTEVGALRGVLRGHAAPHCILLPDAGRPPAPRCRSPEFSASSDGIGDVPVVVDGGRSASAARLPGPTSTEMLKTPARHHYGTARRPLKHGDQSASGTKLLPAVLLHICRRPRIAPACSGLGTPGESSLN